MSVFLSGTVYGQTTTWGRVTNPLQGANVSRTTPPRPTTIIPTVTSTTTSRSPARIYVHQVPGLANLLRLQDAKRTDGLALKAVVEPTINRYKDLTAEQSRQQAQNDPRSFDRLIQTPEFQRAFDAYVQSSARLKTELDRTLNATAAPTRTPVIMKDAVILSALMFQQGVDHDVLLRTTTRRVAQEYDDHYPIADQIPFTVMKGIADGQYQRVSKPALEKLALYLAGAGPSDLAVFERGLYNSAKQLFAKLDAQGLSEIKSTVMWHLFPIIVETCDVGGIHRGLRSESCLLLNEHSREWKEGIQKNGNTLPGNEVVLWDRRHGQMVAFPVGATGTRNCTTVDARALADSFRFGILNFGDCSLSNRIWNCPKRIGGDLAYPNACRDGRLCGPQGTDTAGIVPTTGGGGGNSTNEGGGGSPSGNISSTQGGGSSFSRQGSTASSAAAAANFFGRSSSSSQGPSPQDVRELACREGSGIQSDPVPEPRSCGIRHETQTVCGGNVGEPTGEECPRGGRGGPFSGPGSGNVLPGNPKFTPNTRPLWNPSSRLALDPATQEAAKQAARQAAAEGAGAGGGGSGGSATLNALVGALRALANTATSFILILPGVIEQGIQMTADPSTRGTIIASTDNQNNSTSSTTTTTSSGQPTTGSTPNLRTAQPAAADGIDPYAPSDCTYIGQLMKETGACFEQQINEGLQALGRTPRGRGSITLGSIRGPIDRNARPGPDQDGGDSSGGSDDCFLPDAPLASGVVSGASCGVVVCNEPSAPGQCCGRSARDWNVAAACTTICDGEPALGPDGRCLPECPAESRRTGGVQPGPRPAPVGLTGTTRNPGVTTTLTSTTTRSSVPTGGTARPANPASQYQFNTQTQTGSTGTSSQQRTEGTQNAIQRGIRSR